MKLGDFLNTLAKKAGKENDPALVAILSSSELANREISDDLANYLDTNLMSLEGAKNNPALLNHFKPIVLKALDDQYAVLAEELGISDAVSAEKSTYKKLDLLRTKFNETVSELKEKQGKGANAEKEAQLTAQIQHLQGQLAKLTDERKAEVKALKGQHADAITDMMVKFALTGKKYANKDLPAEVNTLTAKTLLEAKLKEVGAVLVNENGVLKLKQAAQPDMDYVDSGYKTVSFNDFTDKLLADNKLLEVSGGGTPPPATHDVPGVITPGGQQLNSSQFNEALQASLSDVKQ